MTGKLGQKDGDIKKMRHMTKNGKKIDVNFLKKLEMDGGILKVYTDVLIH